MVRLFTLTLAVMLLGSVSSYGAKSDPRGMNAPFAFQGETVRGRVVDQEGNPVVGATVTVVNSSNQVLAGSYTDADGRFSVTLPAGEGLKIKISGIGYTSATFDPTANLDVTLAPDNLELETTIVTGYTSTSSKLLLGSVTTIDGAEFENLAVQGANQAIQGRAAGVLVVGGNGLPNTPVRIRVRGIASINASSEPLYVVDGIIIDVGPNSSSAFATTQGGGSNPLSDINPNDIEDIKTLSDVSSVALYGSRGANGVVLITTKRGKFNSPTRVSLNYEVGINQTANRLDMLRTADYNNVRRQAYQGSTAPPPTAFVEATGDVDWQDEIFRNGFQQRVGVTVSGGSEKTTFFLSFDAIDQETYMKYTDYNRYNGRINITHKASDKLTVGATLSLSRTIQGRQLTDNAVAAPFSSAILWVPNRPVYAVNPVAGGTIYEFGGGANPLANIALNPLALLDQDVYTFSNVRAIGNLTADYKVIPSVTIHSELGTDIGYGDDYFRGLSISPFSPTGEGSSTINQNLKYQTTHTVNWKESFGDHNVSVTGGFSWENSRNSFVSVAAVDFSSDLVKNVSGGATNIFYGADGSEYSFRSFFGVVNYNYKEKYVLTGTIRNDASSRFGENFRVGNFPSIGLGWIFSEESFLDFTDGWLSLAKLTVNYGVAGNAPAGRYQFASSYSADPAFGYFGASGSRPGAGNANLQWEESVTAEGALDLRLFDRYTLRVGYFNKTTDGGIFADQLPGQTGFTTITRNVAEIENKGFEVTASADILRDGALKWNTSLNFSYIENNVVSLPGGTPIINGNYRLNEGDPLTGFYLIRWHGVDQTNGNPLFLTANGTITTTPTSADRVQVGNGLPKFQGGWSNGLSYKGLDLQVLFTFAADYNVYNGTRAFAMNGRSGFNNITEILDAWTVEKPSNTTPIITQNRPASQGGPGLNANQASTRWLEKGDHVRLRSVVLGYNLPKSLVESIGLTSLKVYAQGFNLFVLTPYKGIDPEVFTNSADNGLGSLQFSSEFLTPPQSRSYQFGVNIGF